MNSEQDATQTNSNIQPEGFSPVLNPQSAIAERLVPDQAESYLEIENPTQEHRNRLVSGDLDLGEVRFSVNNLQPAIKRVHIFPPLENKSQGPTSIWWTISPNRRLTSAEALEIQICKKMPGAEVISQPKTGDQVVKIVKYDHQTITYILIFEEVSQDKWGDFSHFKIKVQAKVSRK